MDNPLQEHAEAAERAHEGNKRAALLVAAMAALLALSEQGAKHAEIRVDEASIAATDTWGQFQAKSVRGAMARNFADLLAAQPAPADTAAAARVAALQKRLAADQAHYEHGPDSKEAAADKARDLERERDAALSRSRSFDNAGAALELGIVLATASVIVDFPALLLAGTALALLGLGFDALAFVAPGLGAL